MSIISWAILGAIVLIVLWVITIYNGLIRRRNRVDEAWSDIEVQLKRRHSLIPNLVEVVKGYASHEKEVFEKVTEARSKALGANTPKDLIKAETGLMQALGKVFALAENYPQLRASENFVELQRELTDTEDKIQAARRFYNSNVRDLNTAIQSFPTNVIAKIFRFNLRELFDAEPEVEQEVKVNL